MIKLSIAYRIYPKVSKETPIFNDSKLKLAELCLFSFVRTLKNIDYKFWAILDGCPNEYKDLFRKHIPEERLVFVETNSIGNARTFEKQIEVLSEQTFSDNIYFAEDDYFYLNKPFDINLNALNSGNYDFVTPYDHLDYYILYLHKYKTVSNLIEEQEYRLVNSTTLTFLTTKIALSEARKVFETYYKKNYDVSLWLVLTKLNVYNPLIYINSGIGFVNSLKILTKIMLHTPYEFIFGKRFYLAAPKPSLATHLDSSKLSPEIDWKLLFIEASKELGI